jgi:L-threonylcarbamoyladenylate synthase
MLTTVVDAQHLGSCARRLMDAYWPGPLTLLLPKADEVPAMVTAGSPLVGVRMPAHPVAQVLIAAAGVPIAAPSANSFGRISPTTAVHVLEDLDGRIDAVLDGGETAYGLESTVLDATAEPAVVYRPGVITLQQIRSCCGSAIAWVPPDSSGTSKQSAPESLPSPGVGIRHYAPRARLVLIAGEPPHQARAFADRVRQAGREKTCLGVMLAKNFLDPAAVEFASDTVVFDWGDWGNLPELAHRLFAGLRQLDATGVDLIICPLPGPTGIGAAIQDRLLKAARPAQSRTPNEDC